MKKTTIFYVLDSFIKSYFAVVFLFVFGADFTWFMMTEYLIRDQDNQDNIMYNIKYT